ncbi:MAG: hypothetical protein FWG20_05800 [Candidatus Cloacimonetes bacterium]|nr:hypothetical protein [Candidatus Cloacimonadota bacterium]
MNEKQTYALNKIISDLPDDYKEAFREVAEYAISLGYKPVLKGSRNTYVDFIKSKVKKMIMKIDTDPKFPPRLAIKFFALNKYTGIFNDAIIFRIATWDRLGYKTKCGGCGHCDGTIGYKFSLHSGRNGFLCGNSVLDLPGFCADHIVAVKEALQVQDEFFMKNYN